MRIDLKDIVFNRGKEYNEKISIEMEKFESNLGSFPITRKTDLALKIQNKDGVKLLISGVAEMDFAVPCDRCLTEVTVTIQLSPEREFAISNKEIVVEELDEPEYIIGFELDSERLVYDEILMNWPMKVLCKEDCKGICTKCGCNLNLQECSCDRTELDPRMAAIQDIFNKFKEV